MDGMWKGLIVTAVLGAGVVAPTTASAQDEGPARGFSMWARLGQSSVQELAASAGGAPEFTIGYRGERISLGLGIGFTALRTSDRDEFGGMVSESKTSANLFQVGPDALFTVWRSPDGRTLGNVSAGASIGRLSGKDEDSFTGQPTIESSVSGTLYGLRLGMGGEHFIDRHLAIGVEGGFQGTFASGIEEEGISETLGIGAGGAYAALRVTVVLGSD